MGWGGVLECSSSETLPFCGQVDEIMLTLKQAFSVAASEKSSRTPNLQCESCPMQQLHRLCDRIEGQNRTHLLLPGKRNNDVVALFITGVNVKYEVSCLNK